MPQHDRYERDSGQSLQIGGFGPEFDRRARARIDTVLRRLAQGDGDGQWRELPDRIDVVRRFDDGASGVLVIGFEAHHGVGSAWHVAKIGSPDEIRDEWSAYLHVLRDRQSVLCPPIVVVTWGVLDPGRQGEDEAAVYMDVRQFAALADGPVDSLEHVARSAVAGSDTDLELAETAVGRLLDAARVVFYSGARIHLRRDRMDAKNALGPDLRVLVTRRPDRPADDSAREQAGDENPCLPGEIVEGALVLPGAEPVPPPEEPLGEYVTVLQARFHREGDRRLAVRDQAVIEVLADDPALLAGLTPGPVTLHGRIVGSRSQDTWEHACSVLDGLELVAPGVIEYGGIRTAHPFAALRRTLRDEGVGTLAGRAHGDLNSRNVLLAAGSPYVIDYARANEDAGVPVLRDPAWLELDLLRWPWHELLTYEQLVWVQRLLFAGDRVASLLSSESARSAVTETLADLGARHGDAARRSVRILAAVRRGAHRIHPVTSGEPWWREYQKELLLAAHRAMKWRERQPALWPTQLAVAGVACEALTAPFAHWPDEELAAVTKALLPLFPDTEQAAPLLGDVVQELSARRDLMARHPDVMHFVRAARARVAGAAAGAAAMLRMDELRVEHDRYMDLAATVAAMGRWPDAEPDRSAAESVLDTYETVILGPSGYGKTALLREAEYRLLDVARNTSADERERSSSVAGRLPVLVSAPSLVGSTDRVEKTVDEALGERFEAPPGSLLRAGAVHVLVDDLHRVPEPEAPRLYASLREFRDRHPEVPVTVAVRDSSPPSGLAGWTAVVLARPSRTQAARYLAHSWGDLDTDPGAVAKHVDAALTATEPAVYGAWERSPQLLAMLADLPPDVTASAGRTRGDVLEAYISQLLTELTPRTDEAALRAEELARHPSGPSVQGTGEGTADVDRALREIGLLVADDQGLRFERPDVRDYFAARCLLRAAQDPEPPHRAAIDHHSRGAWEILVSLSRTPVWLREELIRLAADADPVFAARLLAACPPRLRPYALAEPFLTRQRRVLADRRAGSAAHAEAADALAATRAPAGYRPLLEVVSGTHSSSDARVSCLRALTDACSVIPDRPHAQQLRRRIAACCEAILTTVDPAPDVVIAVFETVTRLRLDRLVLLVSAWVRSNQPWPLALAAIRTLNALGVPRTTPVIEDVDRAATSALAGLEHGAHETGAEPAYQRNRLELLGALSPAERLPQLLVRRTSYGVGELIGDLIEEEPDAGDDTDRPWNVLLQGRADGPRLLQAVRDADARIAAAGLHGLLRMEEIGAAQAFAGLAEPGRADRAGAVAQTVRRLPAELLPEAIDFARDTLAAMAADASADLEGAASLVHAVFGRDGDAGFRLARTTHRTLVRLDRVDRFQWPWSMALARCSGTLADVERMLTSDDPVDRDLALDALADRDFLTNALPGPTRTHGFGPAAREQVLSLLGDPEAADAVRVARAACALELGTALSFVMSVAEAGRANAPVTLRVGQHLIEAAPSAELVAGAGYLARVSAPDQNERVRAWLSGYGTSAPHASIEAGRLIGLAYLGDWQPLFAGVAAGRPRCAEAAHNVLDHWLPRHDSAPAEVARWISLRLDDSPEEPGIHTDLLTLRRHAERLAGRTPVRVISG